MTSTVVQVTTPTRATPLAIEGSAGDYGIIGAVQRAGGSYEPHVMRFIADRVREAGVNLDIGANVGILTAVLADACPTGTVYAFEPGPETFEYLDRNIARNGLTNVRLFREGVYSTSGKQVLNSAEGHPGGAFISDTAAHEDHTDVVVTRTLDAIVEDEKLDRVDFVKLDVEGAELDVLEGGRDTLRRFRPVLLLECNPIPLRRFHGADPDEFFVRLREIYGDDVGYLALDGTPAAIYSPAHFADELSRRGLLDLVAGVPVPRGRRAMARALATAVTARVLAAPPVASVVTRVRPAYEPPARFVHAPAFRADFDVNRLVANAGTTVELPWRIENRSRFWYWSKFANHPVTATYRWLRDGEVYERDGIRTLFVEPLRPGGVTTLQLMIAMPAEPGSYVLEATLVQEAFAWFDQIDPSLVTHLPVEVR